MANDKNQDRFQIYFILVVFMIMCCVFGGLFVGLGAPIKGFNRAVCVMKNSSIALENDPRYSNLFIQADIYNINSDLLFENIVLNETYTTDRAVNSYVSCCMKTNKIFSCSYIDDNSQISLVPYFFKSDVKFWIGIAWFGLLFIILIVGLTCTFGNCMQKPGQKTSRILDEVRI